jgi:hypothetical protein
MKINRFFFITLMVIFCLTSPLKLRAQCSVCKISAESNINNHENKIGRGLNKGILYLMAVPYTMGGIAFYMWYRHRKKVPQNLL